MEKNNEDVPLRVRLPKDVLEVLLKNNTQSGIGKMYGVSPSAIAKLVKLFKLKNPRYKRPLRELISKDEAIELHQKDKLSPKEIADKLGFTDVAVRRLLQEYEIYQNHNDLKFEDSIRSVLTKEELNAMYNIKNMSANDIAKVYGVAHTTILTLMEEYEILRRGKKTRSKEVAILELKKFYQENGQFNTSTLMAENSGLERYLRTKQGGVREFCKKNNLSYILTPPKIVKWNNELVIKTIKELHELHNQPVGRKLLIETKFEKMIQWVNKNYDSYEKFTKDFGLEEITTTQKSWTDAKCYRLVKDLFILNKGVITPEIVKVHEKGALMYIYQNHKSFEAFIEAFDLQDYVHVNNIRYDDEVVIRLFKEAYTRKGDLVNSKWLVDNGYHGIQKYITNKGEGSYINGAKILGLSSYVTSSYTEWNDALALENIEAMLAQKKVPYLIHNDFVKFRKTGLREWILKTHDSIEKFFKDNGIEDKYKNMRHVGKELWAYGMKFQELTKEILELFFEEIRHDRWIEYLFIRPDFQLGDSGVWIDAKLSSFAYFTDETVEKYTVRKECKELWIVYLRGHKFKIDNPKVKCIPIDRWIEPLKRLDRQDLVDKIYELRKEVEEVEVNVNPRRKYVKKEINMENTVRKLTSDNVILIREEYEKMIGQGKTDIEARKLLGKQYDCSARNIRLIVKRETWKHV